MSVPANPQMSSVFSAPESELTTTNNNKAITLNNKKSNNSISNNTTSQITQQPSLSHTTENIATSDVSTEFLASTEQSNELSSSEIPQISTSNVSKYCIVMGKYLYIL